MGMEELLNKLDLSKSITEDVGLENLYESLYEYNDYFLGMFTNIPVSRGGGVRLTSYFIFSWEDTDTLVGYVGYYLDGIPVGYSKQMGRKSSIDYYWLSKDKAYDVKHYLESLIEDSLNCNIKTEEDINLYLDSALQITNVYESYYKGERVYFEDEDLIFSYGNALPYLEGDTYKEYVKLKGVGKVKVKDIEFRLNLKGS